MKRYTIHAPCNDQYEEDPEGEWVTYEDANAWWHEMKELPRIQDVIEIANLKAELRAEKDRRVEHRQMNQSLNEQVQKLSARLEVKP